MNMTTTSKVLLFLHSQYMIDKDRSFTTKEIGHAINVFYPNLMKSLDVLQLHGYIIIKYKNAEYFLKGREKTLRYKLNKFAFHEIENILLVEGRENGEFRSGTETQQRAIQDKLTKGIF